MDSELGKAKLKLAHQMLNELQAFIEKVYFELNYNRKMDYAQLQANANAHYIEIMEYEPNLLLEIKLQLIIFFAKIQIQLTVFRKEIL